MSITTTYITGAVAAGDTKIVVNAYTSPILAGISPKAILRFATGEVCLITGNDSTTLALVRGYSGTRAVAHSAYEGVTYGLVSETNWPGSFATPTFVAPVTITNAQEVTLAGTTGTDAAVVTVPSPAILNCSGASGAGINLPVPKVGQSYTVKNTSSGTMNIFCVGGSINGTTGTTAATLTTTGTKGDIFWCATDGAWQGAPTSV